ncbi:uncharacterized protein BO88DRAFT_263183 [Aspergillus vadensis CBS 113365]|uniref:Uncharacterized protein n=1 Tax=Aspergillus vadensis (strain CBS 113365 / IMI 142717 / IBT 24658) TaxID=1448311 RepID=A0A319BE30_ASPVC|nr:hypothetical protein BO88DRAFT_263183 [Aspergillus vadensis CBS 113365]PYH70371.1 hypothetical protein BO88DRAFT_263183 [Aspergillus vadensis CBS 113365]
MPSNNIAEQIERLWKELVVKTPEVLVDKENQVSDVVLDQYQIDRSHMGPYFLKNLENEGQGTAGADIYGPRTLFPADVPILFQPMSRAELEKYPILASKRPSMIHYDPAIQGESPNGQKTFIYQWAYHLMNWVEYSVGQCGARENAKTLDEVLIRRRKLKNIYWPDPFYLGCELFRAYPSVHDHWGAILRIEPDMVDGHRIYLHLTIGLALSHCGKENSMLYEELAVIISAMQCRALQPRVPEDEALFEEDIETISPCLESLGMKRRFLFSFCHFRVPRISVIFMSVCVGLGCLFYSLSCTVSKKRRLRRLSF